MTQLAQSFPVRQVSLLGTGLTTTALGFGCAGVFREPTRSGRQRILAEAYDLGIRHFDVAPMYGLALAERELGMFTSARRGSLTITSKYGISVSALGRGLGRVQGPLRRLMRRRPALRSQAQDAAGTPGAGPLGELIYNRPGPDPRRLRMSLERTLRTLATDYLDVFLLHDPTPTEVASDELCAALEDLRGQGLIRAWGVTGEPEPAVALLDVAAREIPVMQHFHDIFSVGPASRRLSERPARISFGVLSGAVGRVVGHVAADPERRRHWAHRVDVDCASPPDVARLLLRHAGHTNSQGIVLFSSTASAHLRAAAEVFSEAISTSDPQLDAFLGLVESELLPHTGAAR